MLSCLPTRVSYLNEHPLLSTWHPLMAAYSITPQYKCSGYLESPSCSHTSSWFFRSLFYICFQDCSYHLNSIPHHESWYPSSCIMYPQVPRHLSLYGVVFPYQSGLNMENIYTSRCYSYLQPQVPATGIPLTILALRSPLSILTETRILPKMVFCEISFLCAMRV